MPRRTSPFTSSDVARAFKGAEAAGVKVDRVEIEGGKIVIIVAGSRVVQSGNTMDKILYETP